MSTAPATKRPARTAAKPAAQDRNMGTAVATVAAPRLPYVSGLEERFGELGVDKTTWRPLVEAVFPAAKSADSVIMALAYCKARKLDPFKRPVNIVPVWDSKAQKMIETVWPSITEHRITAHRTGVYAGIDDTEYGPLETRSFSGRVKGKDGQYREETVELEFPEWAKVTVYKVIGGVRCPFTAKVFWLEAYGRQAGTDLPNRMWQQRTHGQLEKCAEAAALRKAFPEEISEATAEEMEGQIVSHAPAVPLAEAAADVPRAPAKAEVIDAETGEVDDAQQGDQGDADPQGDPEADPGAANTSGTTLLSRFQAALKAASSASAVDRVWDSFEAQMPPDADPTFDQFAQAYKNRMAEVSP